MWIQQLTTGQPSPHDAYCLYKNLSDSVTWTTEECKCHRYTSQGSEQHPQRRSSSPVQSLAVSFRNARNVCNARWADCFWNVMAHGDAREEKWRGKWRMEWVTSKRRITAEHRLARAVQTMQADVYSSPASSRLNWFPRRFKWTRPLRRKTKSGFCACAITFQTQSTVRYPRRMSRHFRLS